MNANSEVTLDYELTDVVGASVLSVTEKARSKGDGDNVLTPMLTAAVRKVVMLVEQKN